MTGAAISTTNPDASTSTSERIPAASRMGSMSSDRRTIPASAGVGASVTSRVSPGATQPVSIPTTEPGSTTATEPGDTTAALSATPTDHINAAATELVTRPTGAHGHAPISIGIDSWGVDYGLLDPSGRLMGSPIHYRDTRTDGLLELTRSIIDDQSLYEVSGLQFLPINTIYQLQAEADRLPQARHMLMIPDLIAYWLTGQTGAEVTNASTTGLLDVRTREWSQPLLAQLGLPPELFPELRHPGDHIGTLLPEVAEETGLPMETSVIAVASHDTASAVAAIPASGPGFGFLSCGTWSLAGVELQAPVITAASRTANFTNEAGLDGTVRYLRNVMGLWILQECLRLWGSPPSMNSWPQHPNSRSSAPSWTRMPPSSSAPATCPPESPSTASAPASPSPARLLKRFDASSTAWPWLTATPSTRPPNCPAPT